MRSQPVRPAGFTVPALIVQRIWEMPGIAGIPLQNGLDAAAARVTGEQDVASFVAGTTLGSGILFLLLAVLKMGWIAQFLLRAVVTGFVFGAAIDAVIGELSKLTGTGVTGATPIQELWSWVGT